MEPNDAELTEQLGAAADGVEATPDLDAVLAGAGRQRRRQRTLGIGAAAAVVALGVGGVVLVANRGTDELPAAQPDPVVVPLTTLPPSDGDADKPTDTTPIDDVQPASTILLNDSEGSVETDQYLVEGRHRYDPKAPDPAEPYLEQTTEIYRRETPSGNDIQIRRSNVPYGELFGIEWDLPTGSWAECLAGDAVFIGSPDGPVQGLSTWTVQQWLPVDPAQEITIEEHYTENTSNLILRTALLARDVVITQGDEVTDMAEFVDGIAVVEMVTFGDGQFAGDETGPLLTVTVASDTGEAELRTFPVYGDYFYREAPGQCLPPPFPGQELPEPGAEQPADVVAAEGAVRERHAILVDRSDAEKPEDILTDDTGVAEARAQMEAGGFADSAAEATYVIDEVVFIDAETAWFDYSIDAPTGTFGPRFGQARYNGQVWQITRQTICQDLSLANGYCDGDESTPTLEPPLADGVDFDEAVAEWETLQNAYGVRRFCNPLNPCGDFDLPDPGEQPADAGAARAEVTTLMESMYGAGALLDRLDRIDDSTGVAEALEQFEGGSFDGEVSSAVATVDEVVFTTPDGATFRYSIRTDTYGFDRRVGEAVRIDDVWKITRATVCSDLSLGGVSCDLPD